MNKKFTVYILKTSRNTLYTGQTNNLDDRLKQHKNKTRAAAKYIRGFESFELIYTEIHPTRKEAMRREFQIKHWTRKKKEALILGDKKRLKKF